jgi:hypothetical protein
MLFAYLALFGGTGNTLNDRWFTFLIANGATPGHRNDMAKQFLVAEGFTQPSLNDAWLAFWLAGGTPGGGPPPAGNIALAASVFQNVQSFGTDQGVVGFRLTPGGIYQWVADPDTLVPTFWQDENFGIEWVDDGGASNAQFEAQIVPLNIGSVVNPTFIGWAGYNTWLPLTQNLGWYDFNDVPATSSNGGIIQVEVREIATPANIVTGQWEGHADNEP